MTIKTTTCGAALACALLLSAACDSDDGAATPPADLMEAGPYAVGFSSHTITYQPVGVAGERSLEVSVWYPAVAGSGTPTTHAVAGIIEVERPAVLTDATPVPAADLADGATFPVLAYSHGNGGVGLVAYSYGEHFASWGWVVVSPDHTGNTILDGGNAFLLSSLYRPQDLSAVLDWLEDGVPAPLAGRTDDRILAAGHSFGAFTVLSMAGAIGKWTANDTQCVGVAEGDDDGSCALLADSTSRSV
ncbi:MAG: putative dienelactone hydrolase, partial [Myxococcota bacterium]